MSPSIKVRGLRFKAEVSKIKEPGQISHKTIGAWMGILQASYVIHLLPPFYNNFSKRIIKSPKLYFYDTGLACALLGISAPSQLITHSSRGALFENYVINELIKDRFNEGLRSNLF